MNLSFWEARSFFGHFDFIIIGSGIVGLSAALFLKASNKGAKVLVLEKGALPSGASTRNAGFACIGSASELLDDIKDGSIDEVFTLVQKRWDGLLRLREILGDDSLGYVHSGNYEIFRPDDLEIYRECSDRMDELNHEMKQVTGMQNVFRKADEEISKFGFHSVKNMILNTAEGQLNSGAMMSSLIQKARDAEVRIMNGVHVESIEDEGSKVQLRTKEGWKLSSERVLVATNGFAKELLSGINMEPARNQVLVTRPFKNLTLNGCFHFDKGYVYFRDVDSRVLIGGGRNIATNEETTSVFGFSEKIQNYLLSILNHIILPNKKIEIESKWSGIMGVGPVKKPIIEKISPNVVAAVRLGGMGVAIGSIVGEDGAKLLLSS